MSSLSGQLCSGEAERLCYISWRLAGSHMTGSWSGSGFSSVCVSGGNSSLSWWRCRVFFTLQHSDPPTWLFFEFLQLLKDSGPHKDKLMFHSVQTVQS